MSFFAGFFVCAAVIFFAGRKLSHYGDVIAEKTGLGRAWIGLILMAGVTSLPELMVGFSASALVQSADLALGDILGSCAFNLGLLALMDAFMPSKGVLLSRVSHTHVLAASLGIILLSMVGFGLFLPEEYVLLPGISITSILFMVIYFFSVRLIYKYNQKPGNQNTEHPNGENSYADISLKSAVRWYVLYAGIIVVAALFLPYLAEQIADYTGLGKSFVGTLFLAASTSLPEIAVSLAAIRMGAIDLSVGNLMGSNIFNIFILSLNDIYYPGQLLKDANDYNLITVLSAILMSSLTILGITYRVQGKRYLMAWDVFLIFLVFVINLVLLYKFTS